MPLTPQKARFVAEYVKDGNATQAAIRAGYSKHTAGVQGYRLLKDAHVKQALVQVNATAVERVERSMDYATDTAERIVQEAARIAFSDIRGVVRWDDDGMYLNASSELTPDVAASIKEVKVQRTTTRGKDDYEQVREERRVTLYDKMGALQILARRHPEFRDKPPESTGDQHLHLHLQGLSIDELRALAAREV